jgi:hypothetical protein
MSVRHFETEAERIMYMKTWTSVFAHVLFPVILWLEKVTSYLNTKLHFHCKSLI